MSDELDRLRRAMDAATPSPDAARKAANLRLAEKNFDGLQGSPVGARPTPERSLMGRVIDGVGTMLNVIGSRGGLAATTAIVAVAMVYVANDRGLFGPLPGEPLVVVDEVSDDRMRVDLKDAPVGQDATELRMENAQIDLEGDSDALLVEPVMEEAISSAEDFAAAPAPARNQGMLLGALPAERRAAVPNAAIAPAPEAPVFVEPDTEAFANADSNPVKVVAEEPVSTFSTDVDTAAYAVVRSSLMRGQLPPADAVRVEEMINYFPYDYAAPDGVHPFQPTVTVTGTPWNAGTDLVHIAIQGAEVTERPPLNLVFLIDTSGSMQDPTKLPLLKQSFRLMLSQLRPEDQVAIVTYAGSAGRVLDATPAGERGEILAALDRLEAGGSTAGQQGLELAYATAEGMAEEGDVTRVILATDGDFNVGISDPEALKDYIEDKREDGTYLSVLGFGRGNLDDATMQALAQNGNGQASYIDTLSEARKVLVDQLTGALFPIADDVKVQVEWNPATVAEYRLIGYETRALAREDFNNDQVDAGDIGAGHSVTAIYEIARVGSEGVRNDPLRYGTAVDVSGPTDELGFLKLRYKAPGEATSVLIETPIPVDQAEASDDVRFATAIAGFGQLLRGSDLLGGWSYADAIALANGARGEDAFGYRTEAVNLMRLAETLAE